MAVVAETVSLDYARPLTLDDAAIRPAFARLLELAVLSGLCVGVCFLVLSGGGFWGLLHVAVFAATLVTAVRAGGAIARLEPTADVQRQGGVRMMLDIVAGGGLVVIALAPLGLMWDPDTDAVRAVGCGILALAYAMLAATTVRHIMLYRMLAGICRSINRHGMARGLVALGYVKAIYEGIWLTCCAATLLLIALSQVNGSIVRFEAILIWIAVASLVGAMGFGGIWVWMIVAHAQLLRLARPTQAAAGPL